MMHIYNFLSTVDEIWKLGYFPLCVNKICHSMHAQNPFPKNNPDKEFPKYSICPTSHEERK